VPEGDSVLAEMNAPITKALNGEISTKEALRQSADAANATFAKRPKELQV
jgi:hypothetical protein